MWELSAAQHNWWGEESPPNILQPSSTFTAMSSVTLRRASKYDLCTGIKRLRIGCSGCDVTKV